MNDPITQMALRIVMLLIFVLPLIFIAIALLVL